MVPKVAKALMRISILKTSKKPSLFSGHHAQHGFSLMEIMVALLLAALVFFAIPSGDVAAKHRALLAAVGDFNRTINFAANEAVLRNSVVRIRILLNKNPIEYTVEFGPPGNLPLPDMTAESRDSLDEQKSKLDKSASLDRQFTKVPEFEEIKRELDQDVTIIGVGTSSQGKLITRDPVNIYFYPTGEKDAAVIFLTTLEELAWLEVAPFLPDANQNFEPVKTNGPAKLEDVLQSRMEELYKEWLQP